MTDKVKDNFLLIAYLKAQNKTDKEVFHHYTVLANQGIAIAQNELGYCYSHGIGTEINIPNAVIYYKLGAAQNEPKACYNLATMYKTMGNIPEMLKWIHKAVDLKHSSATCLLGLYYENNGDSEQAMLYYFQAAILGSD